MKVMGRPIQFNPEEVREIILPRMPKSLDDRFSRMIQDRAENKVDLVRKIIQEELRSRFLTKPRLEIGKNEKFIKRRYRNISCQEWSEFQIRALYYEEPATTVLMKLIQIEVLHHENKISQLENFQKPFNPKLSGATNFTMKLPKEIMKALVLFAKEIRSPVVAVVNEAIQLIDNPSFGNVAEFDQREMKNIIQRRLVGVDRSLWVEFRKFCIRRKSNSNRMLIAFIRDFVINTCNTNQNFNRSIANQIFSFLN